MSTSSAFAEEFNNNFSKKANIKVPTSNKGKKRDHKYASKFVEKRMNDSPEEKSNSNKFQIPSGIVLRSMKRETLEGSNKPAF